MKRTAFSKAMRFRTYRLAPLPWKGIALAPNHPAGTAAPMFKLQFHSTNLIRQTTHIDPKWEHIALYFSFFYVLTRQGISLWYTFTRYIFCKDVPSNKNNSNHFQRMLNILSAVKQSTANGSGPLGLFVTNKLFTSNTKELCAPSICFNDNHHLRMLRSFRAAYTSVLFLDEFHGMVCQFRLIYAPPQYQVRPRDT